MQPHSGADANLVAFLAILSTTRRDAGPGAPRPEEHLQPHRRRAGRSSGRSSSTSGCSAWIYYSGGHLTHGYRHNVSARLFEAHSYSVDRETKLLDFDAIARQAREVRPLILLAGYSAYPRKINFAQMREIADEVGATFMVDMAHFAGLVAGKVFTGDFDPVRHAHVVTTTTHKTLRGPRGGMVLCDPGVRAGHRQGLPDGARRAAAARDGRQGRRAPRGARPEFRDYAHAIVDNARALAEELQKRGARVLTGGTDNHLVLVDVAESFGLTGRQAESALRSCGMTLNRNSLPFDANGPWYTSGLRLGTPAVTTLGMGAAEMTEIADIITSVLAQTTPAADSKAKYTLADEVVTGAKQRAGDLLARYPLYPEIDLDILTK